MFQNSYLFYYAKWKEARSKKNTDFQFLTKYFVTFLKMFKKNYLP